MTLPTRSLRDRPDLDQLKRQAKELLQAFRAGDADVVAEVRRHYRGADPARFALHDAQLTLARAYGFESWPKLKAYVDGVNATRLCDAVARGDAATVRDVLRRRPELVNMERPGHGEQRALHLAVLNGDEAMVRVLLAHDADPHIGIYPHRDATTAAAMARDRGLEAIAALFDEAEQARREAMSCPNATVSPAQDELNAAIRARTEAGNAQAVALLEADASLIRACDREGRTPLHVACEALNEPMVRWLLAQGADVKRRDMEDRTPLDRAVGGGWGDGPDGEAFAAVATMLRGRGAELTPRAAVALGEADWLRARHAEGDLANPIDPPGGLLTIAVKHGRADMLALLLELGLGPDERMRVAGIEQRVDSWGMPLWHCAKLGRYEMARMLLEGGADPNARVMASGSPVFQAYGARRHDMIALLKQYGGRADPITAGLYRETELGRRMLEQDEHEPRDAGHPAGDSVAEQLLWGAAEGGDLELVRLALERIDWPRDDRRWFKMLEQPLRGGNAECLRLVLDRCDPNIRTRFNTTILHRLIGRYGRSEYGLSDAERAAFATLLLDAGARLDGRDELLASTPLGWACRWGRVEVVKLLLQRGAPATEPDAEPWAQPMAWAVKQRHDEIVALLRRYGA